MITRVDCRVILHKRGEQHFSHPYSSNDQLCNGACVEPSVMILFDVSADPSNSLDRSLCHVHSSNIEGMMESSTADRNSSENFVSTCRSGMNDRSNWTGCSYIILQRSRSERFSERLESFPTLMVHGIFPIGIDGACQSK